MTDDNSTYGSNVVDMNGTPIKGGLPVPVTAPEVRAEPKAAWPSLPQMQALGGYDIDKIMVVTMDVNGQIRSYRDGLPTLEALGFLEVAKAQILLGGAA